MAGNNRVNRGVWAHIGVAALCVVALATACTTTQQAAVKRADLKCGLLGSDCDRLTPGAQAEAKLTDAVTGQLLAAAVDRRVAVGPIKAAAQWQWGDAENAMNAWATQVIEPLYSWTSGAATPS